MFLSFMCMLPFQFFSDVAHLSALTGISAALFDPNDVRSILLYPSRYEVFCPQDDDENLREVMCSVPVHKLNATSRLSMSSFLKYLHTCVTLSIIHIFHVLVCQ